MPKKKEIEMGREDLANKPENIREKIVEGRIEKRMKELSLMDQPFIKDQNISVEELVKQHVATLGENIQVRRFISVCAGRKASRKKRPDFAAEVAAQTGQKQAAEAVEETAQEAAKDTAQAAAKEAKGTKKKGRQEKEVNLCPLRSLTAFFCRVRCRPAFKRKAA